MTKAEEVLRLIILDDSSNHATTVGSLLRNTGQSVRIERAEDDEDLSALLAQKSWDMVIAKTDLPFCTPADAARLITESKSMVPLIILLDDIEDSAISELIKTGARNFVSLKHPLLLVHILQQEFDYLCQQRNFSACKASLQETNKRAQSLVDSSQDAIAYVHEGMYIYANESYLQMFGYSLLEEIEGMPIMDMVSDKDQGKFKEFLRGYLKGQSKTNTLSLHGRKADDEEFTIAMDFSPASYDGEPCIQIMIHDQSASRELEDKLDSLTKYDLLTGAYNHQYFMTLLQTNIEQGDGQGTLFYLAPDNFNSLRERFSIAGSDLLLTDFIKLLQDKLLNIDNLLARVHGEVFALLLPGMSEQQATDLAKKLLTAIEEHIFEINVQSISLTGSVGIALYNKELRDSNELLQRAEKAYNKAAAVTNKLFLYNPLTEGMVEREQQALLIKQIKTALQNNRFVLLYQPIVSLRGDLTENYEVLLRMLDDDGKYVMPGEFIPAAIKAGLMVSIDRWVMANTTKALIERLKNGYQTNFFIKLSGDSLQDDGLLPWLGDLLKAAKVSGSYLTLEIDETVVSRNLKRIKSLIEGLHQLHIKVAIEHFGMAPNHANLLRHASMDYLKLDNRLIDNISQSEDGLDQVKEITAMAQQMGIKTMTDLIENASTLSTLWSCQIDYVQGHFLQEPSTEMNYDFGTL
ncbi:MAG: EAL domain-containing protein [Thiohalomonadaceae bacterium]